MLIGFIPVHRAGFCKSVHECLFGLGRARYIQIVFTTEENSPSSFPPLGNSSANQWKRLRRVYLQIRRLHLQRQTHNFHTGERKVQNQELGKLPGTAGVEVSYLWPVLVPGCWGWSSSLRSDIHEIMGKISQLLGLRYPDLGFF